MLPIARNPWVTNCSLVIPVLRIDCSNEFGLICLFILSHNAYAFEDITPVKTGVTANEDSSTDEDVTPLNMIDLDDLQEA